MKRTAFFTLVLALLLAIPAACAETWDTWRMGDDLFMNRLNDDIRFNDPDAHLYTGTDIVSHMYQTFYGDDGCFAMVYPNDDESSVSKVELFCEDIGCVRRRLDDVAVLSYCFGSRDSVESVSSWCDEWYAPICDAMAGEKNLDATTCECAAFTANMRVYQNDAETWILRITLQI